MQAVLTISIILILFVIFFPLLYDIYDLTIRKQQFNKMIKLDRTKETDFKNFNIHYNEIKKAYKFDEFEIVYWKGNKSVLKLNNDYYLITSYGLTKLFNEDELITDAVVIRLGGEEIED